MGLNVPSFAPNLPAEERHNLLLLLRLHVTSPGSLSELNTFGNMEQFREKKRLLPDTMGLYNAQALYWQHISPGAYLWVLCCR